MSVPPSRRLVEMFQRISVAIEAEKNYLSALDGAIGDADHGITMALGFSTVITELSKLDLDRTAPSDIFRTAASAFLDAVGASTGPLYASAFLRAAQVVEQQQSLSCNTQAAIIAAMAKGIAERGKGQRGDKTMLDAWIPAAEAAVQHENAGANKMWQNIIQAAEAGEHSTRSMVATRGRAARVGERSLGHTDPGAASAVIILHAMRNTFVDG
jgi:dihydroxyacetone kinase-like protein